MIPRLRPYFNFSEILALFKKYPDPVTTFEEDFAKAVGVQHALSFPYMRSAIFSALKAHNIQNAEVIVPAFTCVVVPNAVMISGNIPRFVDINLNDYNMNLDQIEAKINSKTKAIIVTHLYGAPVDLERLSSILKDRPDILIIQDCALAMDTTFKNKPINGYPGLSMYSFSIGKHLSTLEGGIVATNDEAEYLQLKQFRDSNFHAAPASKTFKQILFLFAILGGLNKLFYGFVLFLAENSSLLNGLTVYFDEEEVKLPPDFLTLFTSIQAKVGIAQLRKHHFIMQRRKEINSFYDNELKEIEGITLPEVLEEGVYSHYNIRVKNRSAFIAALKRLGVHAGKELFDYCIPDLKCYQSFKDEEFLNAQQAAAEIVNLPNYPHLNDGDLKKIIEAIKASLKTANG